MNEKKNMTVKEFADKVGVTENTVRSHIRKGKIKAFKSFSRYLIPNSEYERLASPQE